MCVIHLLPLTDDYVLPIYEKTFKGQQYTLGYLPYPARTVMV